MNVSVTLEMKNTLKKRYYHSKPYIRDGRIKKGQGAHKGEVGDFGSQYNEGANEM